VLAVALNIIGQAVALGGDYGRAAQLISEADAVTEATGTPVLRYAAIYLSAYTGREGDVTKLVDATVPEATARGQGNAVQFASLAMAVVANASGQYRAALAPAQDASDDDMPHVVVSMWALIELVEAAARSGEMELARSAVVRLAERNDASANDWSLGVEARSRALVNEGGRRRAVSRGDRPVEPDPATSRARPCPPALRRVASPRGSPRRHPCAAAHCSR
jgi:hypothetical protein